MNASPEPQNAAPSPLNATSSRSYPVNEPQGPGNMDDPAPEMDDYIQGVQSLTSLVVYIVTKGVAVAVFCGLTHLAITISPFVFQLTRAALKTGIYLLADALAILLTVAMLVLALLGATLASIEAHSRLATALLVMAGETPEAEDRRN